MEKLAAISDTFVVLSRAPAVVHLRTGHVGTAFVKAPDRDTFYQRLLSLNVRYVLIGPFGVQELPGPNPFHGLYWARRPDWLEDPRRFRRLWSSRETAVVEVLPSEVFLAAWDDYERGQSAALDGRWADGLGALRAAVKRDPGFGLGHAALGTTLLLSGGNAGEARASLDRALLLNPDLSFARRNRDALRAGQP